jgi:death-on-curing protein
MSAIVYLSLEQAIDIHDRTISISGGGARGSLDVGSLESVLTQIKNDDYYPSFASKLSHLFFGACKFHSFQDGEC